MQSNDDTKPAKRRVQLALCNGKRGGEAVSYCERALKALLSRKTSRFDLLWRYKRP